MSHTPGPWRWWTSNSYRRLSSDASGHDGDVLCAIVQRGDGHPDIAIRNGGADGPDAKLIAAAPDLLAALKRMVEVFPYEPGNFIQCGAIEQAQAAIARAEK